MKVSGRQDIALPLDQVFEALCDFEDFERRARNRGAMVKRLSELPVRRVGSRWHVRFGFRGKHRDLELVVTELTENDALQLDLSSRNLVGTFTCDLVALSKSRTRLIVGIDLRPTTMSARLLLQSLKLVKSKIKDRLGARLENFAAQLEARSRAEG